MKKFKEFISNFFQSKFNIVLTVFVALFLICLILSEFFRVLSTVSIILLALNCFLFGSKCCVYSKSSMKNINKYSVFFEDEETTEIEKPKKNNKFFVLGIFLICVGIFIVYSIVTTFIQA